MGVYTPRFDMCPGFEIHFSDKTILIEKGDENKFVPVNDEIEFKDGSTANFEIEFDVSDLPFQGNDFIVFVHDKKLVGPIDIVLTITHPNGVEERHNKTFGNKPASSLEQLADFFSVWLEGIMREIDLPSVTNKAFNELFEALFLENLANEAFTIEMAYKADWTSGDIELQNTILTVLEQTGKTRVDYIISQCRRYGYTDKQVYVEIVNLIESHSIKKDRISGAISLA